jgi:hypothetical protein
MDAAAGLRVDLLSEEREEEALAQTRERLAGRVRVEVYIFISNIAG